MSNPRAQVIEADIIRRMIEVRRHLHRNPELSNREEKTQAYLR
jgi:metal-dependent amidase/aminoacylase/carboxypeptidase family protein